MGQFEIKSSLTRDYKPDRVIWHVRCDFTGNAGVSSEETKNLAFNEFNTLSKKFDGCDVSIKNISSHSFEGQFTKNGILGKGKEVKETYWTYSANMDIKIDNLDERHLSKILVGLNESEYVKSASYTVELADGEEKLAELKRDLGKKCKDDANALLSGLGSEVIGVDKVVYNSRGNLLSINSDDNLGSVSPSGFNACGYMADESDEGVDLDGFFDDNNKAISDSMVKDILEQIITLSESVTVVFNIK